MDNLERTFFLSVRYHSIGLIFLTRGRTRRFPGSVISLLDVSDKRSLSIVGPNIGRYRSYSDLN